MLKSLCHRLTSLFHQDSVHYSSFRLDDLLSMYSLQIYFLQPSLFCIYVVQFVWILGEMNLSLKNLQKGYVTFYRQGTILSNSKVPCVIHFSNLSKRKIGHKPLGLKPISLIHGNPLPSWRRTPFFNCFPVLPPRAGRMNRGRVICNQGVKMPCLKRTELESEDNLKSWPCSLGGLCSVGGSLVPWCTKGRVASHGSSWQQLL